MNDPDKQLIFDLLDIINEQSETISLLLVRVLDTNPDPQTYAQMMDHNRRTREKFLRMAAKLGWQPKPTENGGC